jgi:isoquinoline 1-oxidoreductase beta subunit
VDAGKILNEDRARRTLRLETFAALGWASSEKIAYTDGRITDNCLTAYDIPQISDLPPVEISFLKNNAAPAKGIGGLPSCCIPAAYVQAVSQAVNRKFSRIPLDARDLWEAYQ